MARKSRDHITQRKMHGESSFTMKEWKPNLAASQRPMLIAINWASLTACIPVGPQKERKQTAELSLKIFTMPEGSGLSIIFPSKLILRIRMDGGDHVGRDMVL